jgi:DNA primase
MPALDFAAVRARIPLAAVLDLLGFVPCESSGDQVRGPCPVHHATSAKSRSFSANLKRNIYKCFKCGSFGNQLDLYASATGLSLFEVAVALCQQLDCEIPWLPPGTRLQPQPADRRPSQSTERVRTISQAGELTQCRREKSTKGAIARVSIAVGDGTTVAASAEPS